MNFAGKVVESAGKSVNLVGNPPEEGLNSTGRLEQALKQLV
ncbi:hypothetical protein [Neobacillus dielmonensis]|nr:hypothetical protein [Neobacillus dielmonensis]